MVDYQQTEARLWDLALTSCRIMGIELWGMEFFPGPGGKKGILRIYIDSQHGVSVEQCAELSRNLSVVLDVEDIVPGSYTLEVSSPGLDRIFFNPAQMKKFVGNKVKLTLKQPRGGRKNFTADLLKIEGERVVLDSKTPEKWSFEWSEIDKAKLVF